MPDYAAWFEEKRAQIRADFFEFLTFESISTDSAYTEDVIQCSEWLSQKLYQYGFSTETWQTSGHPIVFGTLMQAGPAHPTLLIYLHYDVQPVDPIDEWESPPFDPIEKNGVVYARGAIDNKGQAAYTLAALRAFAECGAKEKLNIKVVIEGEEEIGSPTLFSLFEEKKEELSADYGLIVDVDIPSVDQPAITIGTRGIATLNVHMKTAESDLHSGSFGGIAVNPNHIASRLIASFWNDKGSVAIPGFYDGVQELTEEEKKSLTISTSQAKQIRELGIRATVKEEGYALHETGSIRPTLEVNGLHGGYAGEGCKTVIPKASEIKLSMRLVPGQDGTQLIEKVKKFILKRVPKGVEVTFSHAHAAPAFRAPIDMPFGKIVREAYEDVLDKPCGTILCGGTIPVTTPLAKMVNGSLILMGYALLDDGMHAPNEHFSLDRFYYGFLTMTRIFDKLSRIC